MPIAISLAAQRLHVLQVLQAGRRGLRGLLTAGPLEAAEIDGRHVLVPASP